MRAYASERGVTGAPSAAAEDPGGTLGVGSSPNAPGATGSRGGHMLASRPPQSPAPPPPLSPSLLSQSSSRVDRLLQQRFRRSRSHQALEAAAEDSMSHHGSAPQLLLSPPGAATPATAAGTLVPERSAISSGPDGLAAAPAAPLSPEAAAAGAAGVGDGGGVGAGISCLLDSITELAEDQPFRLVVVANRLPVTCSQDGDGSWQLKASTGGLVSALRGLGFQRSLWIGWPGVWVPPGPDRERLTQLLREEAYEPVWLEAGMMDLYYKGFCNSVLWQLFHYDPPSLETWTRAAEQQAMRRQWDAYKAANGAFAEAVLRVTHGSWTHPPAAAAAAAATHGSWTHLSAAAAAAVTHGSQVHGLPAEAAAAVTHGSVKWPAQGAADGPGSFPGAAEGGDVVWVHDYHLMLLPELLKRAVPKMKVGFFLHTPFPSSEVYRSLPVREQILSGVLAADLVGFHTYDYARHFISACARILGFEGTPEGVETPHGSVTRVGTFPIGIETQRFVRAAAEPEVARQVAALRSRFAGRKILLGVDRLDPIKGLPQKLLAFEKLLEEQPMWRDKVVLVQIAVPSRTDVPEYRQLSSIVHEIVGRINGTYGSLTHVPIHYLDTSLAFNQLVALYGATDVAVVTSLRDGMNLVSYEFVACQGDGGAPEPPGVLVMSEFAGAAQSLGAGALLVNPWDVGDVAAALHQALLMGDEERRERHRSNYSIVLTHTAQHWADTFLSELNDTHIEADLRRRTTPQQLDVRQVVRAYECSARRLIVLSYSAVLTAGGEAAAAEADGANRPRRRSPRSPLAARVDPRLMAALGELCRDPANVVVLLGGCEAGRLEALAGRQLDGAWLAAENGLIVRPPVPTQAASAAAGATAAGGSGGASPRAAARVAEPWRPEESAERSEGGSGGPAAAAQWRPLLGPVSLAWMPYVRLVLDYFCERTPGSLVEARATSLVWNYKHTDAEFGRVQARDLVQHLRAGPFGNEPLEVLQSGRSVEVRPVGVTKGTSIQKLLSLITGGNASGAASAVTAAANGIGLGNGAGSFSGNGRGAGKGGGQGRRHSRVPSGDWSGRFGSRRSSLDGRGGGGGGGSGSFSGGAGGGRPGSASSGRGAAAAVTAGFDFVLCVCGHLPARDEDIFTLFQASAGSNGHMDGNAVGIRDEHANGDANGGGLHGNSSVASVKGSDSCSGRATASHAAPVAAAAAPATATAAAAARSAATASSGGVGAHAAQVAATHPGADADGDTDTDATVRGSPTCSDAGASTRGGSSGAASGGSSLSVSGNPSCSGVGGVGASVAFSSSLYGNPCGMSALRASAPAGPEELAHLQHPKSHLQPQARLLRAPPHPFLSAQAAAGAAAAAAADAEATAAVAPEALAASATAPELFNLQGWPGAPPGAPRGPGAFATRGSPLGKPTATYTGSSGGALATCDAAATPPPPRGPSAAPAVFTVALGRRPSSAAACLPAGAALTQLLESLAKQGRARHQVISQARTHTQAAAHAAVLTGQRPHTPPDRPTGRSAAQAQPPPAFARALSTERMQLHELEQDDQESPFGPQPGELGPISPPRETRPLLPPTASSTSRLDAPVQPPPHHLLPAFASALPSRASPAALRHAARLGGLVGNAAGRVRSGDSDASDGGSGGGGLRSAVRGGGGSIMSELYRLDSAYSSDPLALDLLLWEAAAAAGYAGGGGGGGDGGQTGVGGGGAAPSPGMPPTLYGAR